MRRQAACSADVQGLGDRGLLRPGYKADLDLIDHSKLACAMPVWPTTCRPAASACCKRACGYLAMIVSGRATSEIGEPTGALPRALVRGVPAGG